MSLGLCTLMPSQAIELDGVSEVPIREVKKCHFPSESVVHLDLRFERLKTKVQTAKPDDGLRG